MEQKEIGIGPFDEDVLFEEFEMEVIDKLVLFFILLLVTGILVIAAWSGVLIALGLEQGGGPLGFLARSLGINVLLSLN